MHKTLLITTALILLIHTSTATIKQEACTQGLLNQKQGSHISIETCQNIGTFAIGGYYQNQWEKITYNYPKPWPGTYITINIDGKYYASSDHPKDGIQMDPYISLPPKLEGETLTTKWNLPENIQVTQKLMTIENGTKISIIIDNKDTNTHTIAVRAHIDTMVGVNDGAPIYIPGDGLKTTEAEYAGDKLNFKYWKAYNRQDNPSIVATGLIESEGELTYPIKVLIADWKKSKDTAWNYNTDSARSILGDSAIILYYSIIEAETNSTHKIETGVGSGRPVLPKEKGVFGITEITQGNVHGNYCAGDIVELTVDLLSTKSENNGVLELMVSEGGRIAYTSSKETGKVPEDQIKKTTFTFKVPETNKDTSYDTTAILKDKKGTTKNQLSKKSFIQVKQKQCKTKTTPNLKIGFIAVILTCILFLAIAVIAIISLRGKGEVILTKNVDEHGLVKVTVENKTREDIKKCIVEDGIPSQAELKVSTLAVNRADNKLIWNIGPLKKGDKATLEYKIKGVNVLPPARVRWQGGEEISQ